MIEKFKNLSEIKIFHYKNDEKKIHSVWLLLKGSLFPKRKFPHVSIVKKLLIETKMWFITSNLIYYFNSDSHDAKQH